MQGFQEFGIDFRHVVVHWNSEEPSEPDRGRCERQVRDDDAVGPGAPGESPHRPPAPMGASQPANAHPWEPVDRDLFPCLESWSPVIVTGQEVHCVSGARQTPHLLRHARRTARPFALIDVEDGHRSVPEARLGPGGVQRRAGTHRHRRNPPPCNVLVPRDWAGVVSRPRKRVAVERRQRARALRARAAARLRSGCRPTWSDRRANPSRCRAR